MCNNQVSNPVAIADPSLASAELQADMEAVRAGTADLELLCGKLSVESPDSNSAEALAAVAKTRSAVEALLRNVGTYANCVLSVDGSDAAAKQVAASVRAASSKLAQALNPHSLALKLCGAPLADAYVALVPADAFRVSHARKQRDLALPLGEENLLAAFAVDGHSAWGQLYTTLSSSVQCSVDGEAMGVAKAAGLLSSSQREQRRAAWDAIRAAWRGHEEAAAASLNAQAGWRLELAARRGRAAGRQVHYLEAALHSNRMNRKTLDAMMAAIKEAQPLGQRALRLQARSRLPPAAALRCWAALAPLTDSPLRPQARALAVPKMHPCDLLAPPPAFPGAAPAAAMAYPQGLETVASAVGDVHPSIGEFVKMMSHNGWIEAAEGNAKRPGAYCTMFAKSRAPRVYLSAYNGSLAHVSTLAHELGHAYHNWVMRDLPLELASYPMNLAETASLMFENVVGDALSAAATSDAEAAAFGWGDADSAHTFLLNIPARFDFESALFEARAAGKALPPSELRDMMRTAWEGRYGDALEEMDDMFWASKLHFHIAGPGAEFYNWCAVARCSGVSARPSGADSQGAAGRTRLAISSRSACARGARRWARISTRPTRRCCATRGACPQRRLSPSTWAALSRSPSSGAAPSASSPRRWMPSRRR